MEHRVQPEDPGPFRTIVFSSDIEGAPSVRPRSIA